MASQATDSLPRLRLSQAWRNKAVDDAWQIWPCIFVTTALLGRMGWKLPLLPELVADSDSYVAQAEFRPPLYGWLLKVWQDLIGGLEHLPLAQLLLLGAALCVFGIELGRLLRNPLVGPAAILVTLLHPIIHDSPRSVMTEAVFLATILLGLALLCRYCRQGSLGAPLLAAACFGLATLTRSTGIAFLPLPVLLVLFDSRLQPRLAVRHGISVTVVMLLLLGSGMSWTWLRYGHFELGSWSGVSLLGKALVLTEPADTAELPVPVGKDLDVVAESRRLLAEQPDLAARLRAQVQISGDVRFPVFWRAADAAWPEWQAADDREKGNLAMGIARHLIGAHPWQYAALWVDDWLSLVVYPAYWPAWATTEARNPRAFRFCRERNLCWGLKRYDVPLSVMIALFGVSLAGTLLALLAIFGLAPRVLRRRAAPATVLCWGVALVAQASLLGTSAFEAGHARYTVALHVLNLMLLLWMATQLWRVLRQPAI